MFKLTICDPLVRDVIDKGMVPKEGVLPAFRNFPWTEMLAKMRTAREEDICFSPSVEFTNLEDGHVFAASILGDDKATVFYLFYRESVTDDAPAELLDQSAEATMSVLGDFVDGRYDQLSQRFAQAVRGQEKPWWKFWA